MSPDNSQTGRDGVKPVLRQKLRKNRTLSCHARVVRSDSSIIIRSGGGGSRPAGGDTHHNTTRMRSEPAGNEAVASFNRVARLPVSTSHLNCAVRQPQCLSAIRAASNGGDRCCHGSGEEVGRNDVLQGVHGSGHRSPLLGLGSPDYTLSFECRSGPATWATRNVAMVALVPPLRLCMIWAYAICASSRSRDIGDNFVRRSAAATALPPATTITPLRSDGRDA